MYNIAVTGVGGGVGQSILKSLEGSGYNIITMDGELLGAGLYASKKAYLIPYANSPNFIETLLEICNSVISITIVRCLWQRLGLKTSEYFVFN